MTDKYTPKVGDKVRATLGPTTIEGEITYAEDSYAFDIQPEGAKNTQPMYTADGWQFEQIVSVPSKFGAVIRRADGKVFTHFPNREDGLPGYDWYSRGDHWRADNATSGGFTVLFDGVDE